MARWLPLQKCDAHPAELAPTSRYDHRGQRAQHRAASLLHVPYRERRRENDWDFGDGATGASAAATHTYPAPGDYSAVVTATNSAGGATTSTRVTVLDQPIAGLAAASDGPTALGEPTTLTATVTGGSNVVYTWDFGDGCPRPERRIRKGPATQGGGDSSKAGPPRAAGTWVIRAPTRHARPASPRLPCFPTQDGSILLQSTER